MSSDAQPGHPVEGIEFMNAKFYKAAARGKFEVFEDCQEFKLKSLRTPDHNTVLHVYLACPEFFGLSAFQNPIGFFLLNKCPPLPRVILRRILNRIGSTIFIEKILHKCPTLLLEANSQGQTPLHVAARYGSVNVVKFLIQFQAKAGHGDLEQQETDVDAVRRMLRLKDLESNTALHIAVQYRGREVVQELLEFEDSSFPYSINTNQESLLYIAARRGDAPLFELILSNLKSVAHDGPHGRTALHAAAMAGDAGITRMILMKRRNLTKERDEDGHTPLHYAAHLGHSSVVEVLLAYDVTAAYVTDKRWEMTPLLMAARQGHGDIVTKILYVCPDCWEKADKTGWNFLHFVAIRNFTSLNDSIFENSNFIYKHGLVRNLIDAKDVNGITPQHVYDTFKASWGKRGPNKKMEQIVKLLENIGTEEVAEAPVRPIPQLDVSKDRSEKARDGHLVGAALIATVTFAAAITVPGGYKSEGEEQGTPFLIHDAAFKAFIVSDALAFILSLTAVVAHFDMVSPFSPNRRNPSSVMLAGVLLYCAMFAMMIAFSTGTYVVLKHTPWLAVTSCCIGLSFFLFAVLRLSRLIMEVTIAWVKKWKG